MDICVIHNILNCKCFLDICRNFLVCSHFLDICRVHDIIDKFDEFFSYTMCLKRLSLQVGK